MQITAMTRFKLFNMVASKKGSTMGEMAKFVPLVTKLQFTPEEQAAIGMEEIKGEKGEVTGIHFENNLAAPIDLDVLNSAEKVALGEVINEKKDWTTMDVVELAPVVEHLKGEPKKPEVVAVGV